MVDTALFLDDNPRPHINSSIKKCMDIEMYNVYSIKCVVKYQMHDIVAQRWTLIYSDIRKQRIVREKIAVK